MVATIRATEQKPQQMTCRIIEQEQPKTILSFPAAATDAIPDMRGVKETAARFHLPVHLVRALVADGSVHAIQAGSKKIWVNQQSMIAYLNGDSAGVAKHE